MKWLVIISCLISLTSLGQGWRDTLSMAREAYKKQQYGDALSYYESAQKSAPEGVNLSDEMAQSAYKARDFEKAEKIYQQNQRSKITPKEKAETQHNLGNARMKQKNYQGAIDAYKEALRNNPKDEETRYNLSEAIRQLKEEQKQNKQDQSNSDQNNQNNQNNTDQNNQDQSNKQDQNKGNNKSNNSNNEQKSNDQGTLQNKTVERLLDQLMKDEAETKRKMAGSEKGSSSSKSGKDW